MLQTEPSIVNEKKEEKNKKFKYLHFSVEHCVRAAAKITPQKKCENSEGK
jgi:hypothetical protein